MKDVSPAATYAALLPELVKAGRDVGYAIAPHGSMERDLDLIAVPWTREAGSAEQLILRLMSVSGGHLMDGSKCVGKDAADKPIWEDDHGDVAEPKPHGRRAWSIHIGHRGNLYLDVSVMPRRMDDVLAAAGADEPSGQGTDE